MCSCLVCGLLEYFTVVNLALKRHTLYYSWLPCSPFPVTKKTKQKTFRSLKYNVCSLKKTKKQSYSPAMTVLSLFLILLFNLNIIYNQTCHFVVFSKHLNFQKLKLNILYHSYSLKKSNLWKWAVNSEWWWFFMCSLWLTSLEGAGLQLGIPEMTLTSLRVSFFLWLLLPGLGVCEWCWWPFPCEGNVSSL